MSVLKGGLSNRSKRFAAYDFSKKESGSSGLYAPNKPFFFFGAIFLGI